MVNTEKEEIVSSDMTNKTDLKTDFTIGVVAPISDASESNPIYSEKHWREVLKLVKDSTSMPLDLVSESDDAGIIISKIVSNLANMDLIICDVSSKNPNVMFELGLRLAFDKPIILIKDELTDYSFDTSPIKHLNYPSNLNYVESRGFQKDLKKKIDSIQQGNEDSYLSHFKIQKVAKTLPEEEISEVQALHLEIEQLSKNLKNIPLLSRKVNSFPSKSVLKNFISNSFPNTYELNKTMLETVTRLFRLENYPSDIINNRLIEVLKELKIEEHGITDEDLPF
ncbi:MAG: hypothetical protein ABF991_14940 [Liquorilactobacillus hordei]|uniref:hypothetical protein n=1 Tax=Liquorilactobacillus hordei TaxID=468911 RepID=UPI0039E94D08